jgi:sulfoxide reductase heme-binding subunit YedZ
MALWHDRRGRFSPLRAATLLGLMMPGIALVYAAIMDQWGPRPINEATHFIGLWGIRFLMVSLLMTPLRRLARWPQLVDVRRMIGVATWCYLAVHFFLYIVDQAYDLPKVASEIVLRIYLTIGFVAFTGLTALAITSNDYMVRRLGGMRWRRLHQLIYLIGALACIHYFMQVKLDVFHPTILAGFFTWLMLYRVSHWQLPRSFKRSDGELPLWYIALLGIVTAALTFVAEAIGFWIGYGVSPLMVLEMDFTFAAGVRAGWYVFAGGMIMFLVGLVRLKPEGGFTSSRAEPAARQAE